MWMTPFFAGADDGIAEQSELIAKFGADHDATVDIEVAFCSIVVSEREDSFDVGRLIAQIFKKGKIGAPDGFGIDPDGVAVETCGKDSFIVEVVGEEVEPVRW
jgi:hypothetical protein